MKSILDRCRSWAVWISIASLIVICVKTFADIDISTEVDTILNALLPVVVGFGIVNNPTDREHF